MYELRIKKDIKLANILDESMHRGSRTFENCTFMHDKKAIHVEIISEGRIYSAGACVEVSWVHVVERGISRQKLKNICKFM